MNLAPSEEQVMLKDALDKALTKTSSPARIRAGEATGFDPELWTVFQELGLPLLRVPEENGGAGGSLFDAVIVAESLGEHLASIPGIETIVVARLLAALGSDRATGLIGQLAEGGKPVALALHDAGEQPRQIVGAAAAADWILFRHGDEIRLVAMPAGDRQPNIGALPAREVALTGDDASVLGSGHAAVAAFEAAVEEWKLLNAAAIAAAARKAIVEAANYAREREAFGRPIGSFQGLAHPLAEIFVEVEGAALLIRRTLAKIEAGDRLAAAMIGMCAWWTAQVSVTASIRAMRVFGGYGMTNEYDAQLYFRRVTAWSLLAGDPAKELAGVGDRMWGNEAPALPDAGATGLDFNLPAEAEAAADIAREVFKDYLTAERRQWVFDSEDGFSPDLYKLLAARGVLYADWPKESGGPGLSRLASAAIRQAFADEAWPHVVLSVTDMLGKMIIHFGSDQAKREILPELASGDAYGCLCYTEPSCGSDVFAARTTATRDGDDWLINGQKIFTSQGHIAKYGLMIARTSNESKHGGTTVFAVPLEQPGYRCDPIDTVGGERTNTTFYDDVRVPDAYRLGEVNGGVKVLAAALTIEQGSGEFYISALRETFEAALQWAEAPGPDGSAPIRQADVRSRLAAVATRIEVAEALSLRTIWGVATDNARKHFGPSTKLFASEARISCGEELMRLAAPYSLLGTEKPFDKIEGQFRRAIPSTIYAGTSEVQRSLVAEAGLGLPRSRS
jgi:alkylation response protein AidB-like acyl-CoA dehydrogenase